MARNSKKSSKKKAPQRPAAKTSATIAGRNEGAVLASEATKSAAELIEQAAEPIAQADPPVSTAHEPNEVVRAAPTTMSALAASLQAVTTTGSDGSSFYFTPSPESISGLPGQVKPKIETIELSAAPEGGSLLRLAGGSPEASSAGRTEGFCVRVSDAFEREASTRTISVRVLARSADATPARLGIAYSTNEVGNSGWRWREVGPAWEFCELVWNVPKIKNGNGDFIGLMPDKVGAPGIEIHSVGATIL